MLKKIRFLVVLAATLALVLDLQAGQYVFGLSDVIKTIPGVQKSSDGSRLVGQAGSGVSVSSSTHFPYTITSKDKLTKTLVGGDISRPGHQIGIVVGKRYDTDSKFAFTRYYLESGVVESITQCLYGRTSIGNMFNSQEYVCYLVGPETCSNTKVAREQGAAACQKCSAQLAKIKKEGNFTGSDECQTCEQAVSSFKSIFFKRNQRNNFGPRYINQLLAAKRAVTKIKPRGKEILGFTKHLQKFKKFSYSSNDDRIRSRDFAMDIYWMDQFCSRFKAKQTGTGLHETSTSTDSGDR